MIEVYFNAEDIVSDVSISERKATDDPERWDSDYLVCQEAGVSFGLRVTDDTPPYEGDSNIMLDVSFHHAVNEETGRGFHANMKIPLTRDELEKFGAFIVAALAVCPETPPKT